MSKHLLTTVTSVAFALAASSALAQSAAPVSTTSTSSTTAANGAAQTAVATGTLAAAASTPKAGLTRAQVQAEYLEARKNGTLIETEADMDVAQTRKHYAK